MAEGRLEGGNIGGARWPASPFWTGRRPEAIAYVRRHYEPHSVETPWQRRFVPGFR